MQLGAGSAETFGFAHLAAAEAAHDADLYDLAALSAAVRLACHAGHPARALARLDSVAELASVIAPVAGLLGEALFAAGQSRDAIAAFEQALRLDPDCDVFVPMAWAMLPGPSYLEHLSALHDALRPQRYLEIGVFQGDTFRLAKAQAAFGVDPEPRLEGSDLFGDPRIIHLTSDAFFAAGRPTADWQAPIDLAFIDGLHLFEQVLRDFIHVERHCGPASVVVLHDTIAIAEAPQRRQPRHGYWTGDVWKLLPCLEALRPDLSILTVPTFPSGLTIVTGLNPGSRTLHDGFDEAVARFSALGFADAALRQQTLLSDVPNDPSAVVRRVLAQIS